MSSLLNLRVEFGGGLELLFSNQRSHTISVPSTVTNSNSTKHLPIDGEAGKLEERPADVAFLIHWLKDNLLKEREELFIEGGTVRPGILVLINDIDWELEGEGEYVLKEGDEVVLISTLHGG